VGETPSEIRYDIDKTRKRMAATIDAIGYKFDLSARARYRLSHIVEDVSGRFSGVTESVGESFDQARQSLGEGFDQARQSVGEAVAAARDAARETVSAAGDTIDGGGATVKTRFRGVMGHMQTDISDVRESVMDTVSEQTAPIVETAKQQGRVATSFVKDNALLMGIGAFAAGLIGGLFIPRMRIEEERVAPIASKATSRAMEAGEHALDRGVEMAKEALGGESEPARSQKGPQVATGQAGSQHTGATQQSWTTQSRQPQRSASTQASYQSRQPAAGQVPTSGQAGDDVKGTQMNWDIMEGKWKELKGQARSKWGDLTDDEWDQIAGNKEKLVGKLQQKYGYTKDEAERQADEFFRMHEHEMTKV
jgi:uncharacterized protein YjbJ (UPF0337 family)